MWVEVNFCFLKMGDRACLSADDSRKWGDDHEGRGKATTGITPREREGTSSSAQVEVLVLAEGQTTLMNKYVNRKAESVS